MNSPVQTARFASDIRKLLFAAGLACVAIVPAVAQPQGQIPAGSTRSLAANGNQPPKTKKILAEALTPETRATLQAAMDSQGN